MIRRSGRVVEGGTLLRCYTSQRGIEGSNPSSSATKVLRLQAQREATKRGGSESDPYYTNAARTPSFAATKAAFVILYLYSRPPEVVVAFAAQLGLAQPQSVFLPAPMQDAGYGLRSTLLP